MTVCVYVVASHSESSTPLPLSPTTRSQRRARSASWNSITNAYWFMYLSLSGIAHHVTSTTPSAD